MCVCMCYYLKGDATAPTCILHLSLWNLFAITILSTNLMTVTGCCDPNSSQSVVIPNFKPTRPTRFLFSVGDIVRIGVPVRPFDIGNTGKGIGDLDANIEEW